MSQSGSISVRVFTGRAQIPLPGSTVTISRRNPNGKQTLLALRVTNENGEILPILVPTPSLQSSESPGTRFPFTSLDIRVNHPAYQMELIEDVQVFPGILSIQNVQLIPLYEHAVPRDTTSVVQITPQAL